MLIITILWFWKWCYLKVNFLPYPLPENCAIVSKPTIFTYGPENMSMTLNFKYFYNFLNTACCGLFCLFLKGVMWFISFSLTTQLYWVQQMYRFLEPLSQSGHKIHYSYYFLSFLACYTSEFENLHTNAIPFHFSKCHAIGTIQYVSFTY